MGIFAEKVPVLIKMVIYSKNKKQKKINESVNKEMK